MRENVHAYKPTYYYGDGKDRYAITTCQCQQGRLRWAKVKSSNVINVDGDNPVVTYKSMSKLNTI